MKSDVAVNVPTLQTGEDDLQTEIVYKEEPTGEPICEDAQVFPAPTAYTSYKDGVTGIQVQLPYNPNWGGWRCQLHNPIRVLSGDTGSLVIEFGPFAKPIIESTLSSERAYFGALAPTSSTSLLNALTRESPSATISARTINGMPVYHVDYPASYDRGLDHWYALGRNYLFSIQVLKGVLSEDEIIKIIQSLRVMK